MIVYFEYIINDEGLTAKEMAVVKLHCNRGSDQELADAHGISINTFRQYKSIILQKKNIGRIEQLIKTKEIKNE